MRKGPPRPSKFDIPPELLLPPPAPPLDLCSPGILATLVQKERAKPRSYVPYTPLTVRVPDYLLAQQDQVDGAYPRQLIRLVLGQKLIGTYLSNHALVEHTTE